MWCVVLLRYLLDPPRNITVFYNSLHICGSWYLLQNFPQCGNGLIFNRNKHVCLYHSITRGGSWYGKWKNSQCLYPQSPTSWTLSHNRLLHLVMKWTHVPIISQCQMVAVASAAKMVLLSGSLLDSWRRVVSPFWKWRLMTAAVPNRSFWSNQRRLHHVILLFHDTNWTYPGFLFGYHMWLTPSMRWCSLGSYSFFPGRKRVSSRGRPNRHLFIDEPMIV